MIFPDMPHVRCSKCEGRTTLRRKPSDYVRVPRCKRCGRKMVADPIDRRQPHYRIDRYRPRFERGKRAKLCNPVKTGCRGYSFIHRRGSGYCDHNPNLTMDMLKHREEHGSWA